MSWAKRGRPQLLVMWALFVQFCQRTRCTQEPVHGQEAGASDASGPGPVLLQPLRPRPGGALATAGRRRRTSLQEQKMRATPGLQSSQARPTAPVLPLPASSSGPRAELAVAGAAASHEHKRYTTSTKQISPSFGAPKACFRSCSPPDPTSAGGTSRQPNRRRLGKAFQATTLMP